jgi:hypothetical protein
MRHLLWIPATAGVGFGAAFVFADVLTLPVDSYYLLYFLSVAAFAMYYARRTEFEARRWIRRRAVRSVVLGGAVGLVLMQGVLARPETPELPGLLVRSNNSRGVLIELEQTTETLVTFKSRVRT